MTTTQETKDKIIQDIIFILDESGSMSSMEKEPVQAVNNFIRDQKKSIGNDGATFSLWTFNTEVSKVFDDQDLQTITEFKNFKPNSMTALYDAIGYAITTKKQKKKYENVICVILTDGNENCSKYFSRTEIYKMIKDMEDNHGWKFIYLGANQDAFASGSDIGIDQSQCAQYECSPGEMIDLVQQTSIAISQYRTASNSINNKKNNTLNISII